MDSKTLNRIRKIAAKIPPGKVTTYGDIAKAAGLKDSRLVSSALWASRDPRIPSHRIVKRGGFLAPSYASGQQGQKEKLASEGIEFSGSGSQVNMVGHFWRPRRAPGPPSPPDKRPIGGILPEQDKGLRK